HFLAAKYVGIRVEQFAVGFGQALLAWRKGIGVRVGTTTPEFERRVNEYLAAQSNGNDANHQGSEIKSESERMRLAAEALNLGETEYRLNWTPLGGYVKMLGQDDLKPGVTEEDPRAYNKKSIGARMLVV